MNFFCSTLRQCCCCLTLLLWFSGPLLAHTVDLHQRKTVTFDELLDDLATADLVFVGEQHDSLEHHKAQHQIIQGLVDRGLQVTIALEMFRQDSQPALDDWVDGRLGEEDFLVVFNQNWSMWPVYREIFELARDRQIPMLGLNTDRRILRKVSSEGFASLDANDLKRIPEVACDVDMRYQAYMKKALGGHVSRHTNFQFFCEAQLVWDAVMASRLIEEKQQQPERVIVVLAGIGHAWKHGIPEQVRRRSDLDSRVILPEVPGRTEIELANNEETDYLMLGLDEGPLH